MLAATGRLYLTRGNRTQKAKASKAIMRAIVMG